MKKEYIAPSIKIINNVINNCEEIINMVTSANEQRWRQSSVKDNEKNNQIRNSREISVPYGLSAPRKFFHLAQDIFNHAKSYSSENGFSFSHMESLNILEYLPNEGFYDIHSDSGPLFPRSMSAILYLNDVTEGGETWFDKFGLSVKPEKGKLILFPSNYAYTHQALPPVNEKKYVVVTWFGMELDKNIFERYYNDNR